MKQLTKWMVGILYICVVLGLTATVSYGFDVRPGGGWELFEIREMEDGKWEAGINQGVSGGVIFDLEMFPIVDPLFKVSLHPGAELGEGKFRLASSVAIGLFPWLEGKVRLVEVGVKYDLTGKPDSAKNPYSILIMMGYGWGSGE